MSQELLVERFFETLISGHRPAAREIVSDAIESGASPVQLVTDLFWPTYEMIERLYRADQLTRISHHLATRLLRVLIDQNAALLRPQTSHGKTIFALCGPRDADELGAQMAVDLLEHSGFTVSFAGGSIPSDEVLAQVHEHQPDMLVVFASAPSDLPELRQLIDTLHEIGACPNLRIAVGGGVFNRAEGLAEEIGADVWAESPLELVEELLLPPVKRAEATEQRAAARKRRPKREAA